MRGGHIVLLFGTLACTGCGIQAQADGAGGGSFGSVGSGPSEPPPTGNKWDGVVVTGECGRKSVVYVPVDEVCGGIDDPAYMDYFQAPIMRDGAKIGPTLFAVDATHIWVLDAADPTSLARRTLVSGLGQPMAVASHDDRLLVAAGREGLLVLDVSVPEAPARLATVALDGPALDVSVDGDIAYVSTGKAGVALVDLSASPPVVQKVLAVPGFAAAAKARDGRAYVAACDTFAVVDVATGSVLDSAWVADAKSEDGILVAPAKDVELDGDTAYVAAGRFGAVAVDVTDPTQVEVKGNCTLPDEQGFYASGVHVDGARLFVAGGEWGILPVDVSAPACTTYQVPLISYLPDGDVACSTAPPWEVLSWQETWLPPVEPGRDPLQVITDGDQLYAFGDATRIGIRAVDVRTKTTDELTKVGRYEEPRMLLGVVADPARVLAFGKAGTIFDRSIDGSLVPAAALPDARIARAAVFLADGRYVLALPGQNGGTDLVVEGVDAPISLAPAVWPGSLASQGTRVLFPEASGVRSIDVDTREETFFATSRAAELPQAITASASSFLVAAPEWTNALRIAEPGNVAGLDPQGTFDADDIGDIGAWQSGLPRRFLGETADAVVEIAGLGGRTGLTLHPVNGQADTIELPPGTYTGLATGAGRAFLVATERGRYTSSLVTASVDGGSPRIEQRLVFTGDAAGLALTGGSLYVADADRGVVVYDVASGLPQERGVMALEIPR